MSATAPTLFYERMPPPGVVFGCLLPVPWAGAAVGLLLAFGPTGGLPDRFAPLALALVHGLAVGMLLPAMLGALFQLFPVVAGVPVPGARWVSPCVAATCVATAIALATGFLGGGRTAFALAAWFGAPLLAIPAVLLILGGLHVVKAADMHGTVRTLRRIGWALLLTLATGATLGTVLALGMFSPAPVLLNLHVGWGLGGWLATLLAGVASTVLPMFWQSPRLPERWHRWMPGWLWAPLLLGSLIGWRGGTALWQTWGWLALGALSAAGLGAVYRARRRHDPGWPLWLGATGAWFAVAVLGIAARWLPAGWPVAWWMGVLALVGGGVLPINAMLGKIIPFMVWMHLRRLVPRHVRLPAMQTLIGERQQHWHARLLLLAALALLLLPVSPGWMVMPAGLLFAVSQLWLGAQLCRALWTFRGVRRAFTRG
ncbi:hypothetical protein DEE44_12525 [Ralstonia pickettii]|jgi:hypothetical protein|uniref:hypothetical protein n=1 Tax=Ralstonia pickettii TaxID=329 RepID=UPI0015FC01B2|nr:hypothetical protein [Ralstonia pickettii]MBA9883147.1 hypothetical protein [Ralstonia pickettii]MBA9892923.1 hypothetical protein [Ralstonia pickettii]MBA9925062.1 hypothetical protein [Ralstonia pickettii]MBB0093565.1 hypothetical protein [Ralstonia pickettii]MBB0102724.1 hypothetical protein [Ralstonia pickettii]